jgi:Mn2+/Fe2+ NRAMP family transporter
LALVWFGGFKLFERVMALCIAVMFITVISTALLAEPEWGAVARGLALPTIPEGGLPWVFGVLGGVGGTLTLLSYGYWIREEGRDGAAGLRACRVDLSVGYTMTALFGVAMIMIGSRVDIEGRGASVAPLLAGQLGNILGPVGSGIFLVGFWGAVFSSLLGVWQSVPYLFADFVSLRRGDSDSQRAALDLTQTPAYRGYLLAIAVIPLPLLWVSVKKIQLSYAVLGSLFMPLLALTLLLMNNRRSWVGEDFRNSWLSNAALVVILILFGYLGFIGAVENLSKLLLRT